MMTIKESIQSTVLDMPLVTCPSKKEISEYEKGTGVYVKNRIFYWDFYSDVKGEINKL